MIITVVSFKGGVGKTTTAIHLAAYLQQHADTLLIDGDPNCSATGWAQRGKLPFEVLNAQQATQEIRKYHHIVIDTEARPTLEALEAWADSCDLLVLPTTPDILALDALVLTVESLTAIGANRYRILLTIIPPKPSRAGESVRAMLLETGLSVFQTGVRRLSAFQKAALAGVPVYAVSDPKAEEGWQDYHRVGQELL